jgi:hypothetical protein
MGGPREEVGLDRDLTIPAKVAAGLAVALLRKVWTGLPLLLALFIGAASTGCFTFTVRSQGGEATAYQGQTIHAYLWNLVEMEAIAVAEDCGDNALSTVRAKTNYLYLVVGVLTFGAWVPMEVEWRCAKDEWIDLQLDE